MKILKAYLKPLLVLQIFLLLSEVFGYVEKRIDNKTMANFKTYDVTRWTTNLYNIPNIPNIPNMQYTICNIQYTIQYTIYNIPNISTSKGNRVIGFPQVQKYSMRIFFLKKSCRNWGRETSSSQTLYFYLKKKSFIHGK